MTNHTAEGQLLQKQEAPQTGRLLAAVPTSRRRAALSRRRKPFPQADACDERVTLAAAIGNVVLRVSFPTRRRFASQHVQKRCFAAGGEPWGSQHTSRAAPVKCWVQT